MSLNNKREIFSEIIVGLFMVAVLGLLVYFTLIISGVEVLGGKSRVPITVTFEDAGGLKARDSVIMRGMVVGAVGELRFAQDRIKVTLNIEEGVTLREGCRFSINTGSLFGGNYLLIEEGDGEELPLDSDFQGEPPYNWMRDLGTVIAKLRDATSGEQLEHIVSNLQDATKSIRNIVGQVEEGTGTLGKLFSADETLYNNLTGTVANLEAVTTRINTGTNSLTRLLSDDGNAYANLRDSIANVKAISDRLEKGESSLGKLLSADSAVYDDLLASAGNIRSVTERLEKGEGTLGKLLSADATVYNDLQASMEHIRSIAERLDKAESTLGRLLQDDNKLYNEMEATLSNLKLASERLAKGEGTLGKLSADDELYNDVHHLIKDVRQTVDNFRDTTPITAFASLIMGAL